MFIKPKKKFWLAGTTFYAVAGAAAPFGITEVSSNTNTVAASSFTFTAQGIGAADPNRIVVVCIAHAITSLTTVTSVTIGGNAATQAPSAAAASGVGTASDIWYLAVPSGTTANIVVNMSGSEGRIAIDVFRVVGPGCAFSTAAHNNTGSGVNLATIATVPAGGGAIGVINVHSATAGAITGTNLTIDQSGLVFGGSTLGSGHNTTASGSTTFTFSWTTNSDIAMSIATFSP